MKSIVTFLLLSSSAISFILTSHNSLAQSQYAHNHKAHHDTEKNSSTAEGIIIHAPIIKPTPPGITNSAAYFHIMNHSDKDIELINATSTVADRTEIHEHKMNDGVMKMQKVTSLTIPAKSTINFEPGSYHIMFINVKQAITEKQEVKLTLEFSDGSATTVTAIAKEPKMSHGKKHKHHGSY
ncbi:MAG: copper chaperone PCu(A)C [Cellvibrionaceae bacterium]